MFTVFTALLFSVGTNRKGLKSLPIGKWIKKLWYIHIIEYHSITKRELLMKHYRMNLKSLMLSEKSQTQDRTSLSPFLRNSRRGKDLLTADQWLQGSQRGPWYGTALVSPRDCGRAPNRMLNKFQLSGPP